MKQAEHRKEASMIGADSYALLNFDGLPMTASKKEQVDALMRDQSWQAQHYSDISRRIDFLVAAIEEAHPPTSKRPAPGRKFTAPGAAYLEEGLDEIG